MESREGEPGMTAARYLSFICSFSLSLSLFREIIDYSHSSTETFYVSMTIEKEKRLI